MASNAKKSSSVQLGTYYYHGGTYQLLYALVTKLPHSYSMPCLQSYPIVTLCPVYKVTPKLLYALSTKLPQSYSMPCLQSYPKVTLCPVYKVTLWPGLQSYSMPCLQSYPKVTLCPVYIQSYPIVTLCPGLQSYPHSYSMPWSAKLLYALVCKVTLCPGLQSYSMTWSTKLPP